MLPCIVTDFYLNNQPDALIIPIYSVIKLYMFWASSLHINRSFLLTFGTGKLHAGFWWPLPSRVRVELVPSWLCLEAIIKNLYENYQCRKYVRKLLAMGRGDVRNM